MTVGEMIKKYCDEHGLSYRQFAGLSDLTSGYISMLVNNRNPKTGKPPIPTLTTYQKIADAMHVPFDVVLRETQRDVPTYFHSVKSTDSVSQHKELIESIAEMVEKATNSDILSHDERRLLTAYRNAIPEIRKAVIQLLEINAIPKAGVEE